jgi:hypothetical protein
MKSGVSVELSKMGGFAKVFGRLNSMSKYMLSTLTKGMPIGKCPHGVSPTKVLKVGELTNVLDDLLKWTKAKVLHLEAERNKLSEKLIGLQFNMEECHVLALQAQDAIASFEPKLQQLSHDILLLEKKVQKKNVLFVFWLLDFETYVA